MRGNLLCGKHSKNTDPSQNSKLLSPTLLSPGTWPLLRPCPQTWPEEALEGVGRVFGATLIVFVQPIPTPLLQLPASLVRAVQGQESL